MTHDDMKAEFGAWYLASVVEMLGEGVRSQAETNLAWTRDDGSYADPMLRLGLMAWEASRAAVVVELPAVREIQYGRCGNEYDSGVNFGVELSREAIEAAGLKVPS
jgi:hypothetical protein